MKKSLFPALFLAAGPTFAIEPETVHLNLSQFLEMYENARDPATIPEVAPREFTLSSASYRGEVLGNGDDADSAVFAARLHVDVLKKDGWVTVPLVPATVGLRSARVAGKEATVTPQDGWLVLVTDKKGAFDIDLDFAVSVIAANGESSLAFELAPSGATTARLSVPSSDALDFVVEGATLSEDRIEGGRRIVEAVLPGRDSLAMRWQRAREVAAKEEPRLYAEMFTLVSLGDGLLSEQVTAAFTILQAGVDTLSLRVPEGLTVVEAHGAGLRDWSVGADRTMTVRLNYEAQGAYTLSVQAERPLGGGAAEIVPLLQPQGVERSKGWVGVEARGTLEVASGAAAGLTPIDVRLLPAAILGVTDQPLLLGWKYLGGATGVPLTLTSHEDVPVLVTLLDEARATTMFTIDGRRLTSVRWRVRNNRKQFLRLELPQGAELWSASVAGQAVQPAKGTDGRVLVPLVRSQAASGALADFEVGVVYVEAGTAPSHGNGSFRASLPRADVPVTYVAWTVWAPSQAKVREKTRDGSLRPVHGLSTPFDRGAVQQLDAGPAASYEVRAGAAQQMGGGGLGDGAAPVSVAVPLEGRPMHWEKLLALGEELWVGFDYRGLR